MRSTFATSRLRYSVSLSHDASPSRASWFVNRCNILSHWICFFRFLFPDTYGSFSFYIKYSFIFIYISHSHVSSTFLQAWKFIDMIIQHFFRFIHWYLHFLFLFSISWYSPYLSRQKMISGITCSPQGLPDSQCRFRSCYFSLAPLFSLTVMHLPLKVVRDWIMEFPSSAFSITALYICHFPSLIIIMPMKLPEFWGREKLHTDFGHRLSPHFCFFASLSSAQTLSRIRLADIGSVIFFARLCIYGDFGAFGEIVNMQGIFLGITFLPGVMLLVLLSAERYADWADYCQENISWLLINSHGEHLRRRSPLREIRFPAAFRRILPAVAVMVTCRRAAFRISLSLVPFPDAILFLIFIFIYCRLAFSDAFFGTDDKLLITFRISNFQKLSFIACSIISTRQNHHTGWDILFPGHTCFVVIPVSGFGDTIWRSLSPRLLSCVSCHSAIYIFSHSRHFDRQRKVAPLASFLSLSGYFSHYFFSFLIYYKNTSLPALPALTYRCFSSLLLAQACLFSKLSFSFFHFLWGHDDDGISFSVLFIRQHILRFLFFALFRLLTW